MVALLAGQQTLQVAASSPGWAPLHSGLGQATYTCASVTKQYNLVPPKDGGSALLGSESNRGPGGK